MGFVNKHIVQTLCFDTQTATEELAHTFADKVKSIDCETWLSRVLSRYDNLPGTIRIDQLLLDIGTIDPEDLDSLEELITVQLEELLTNKLIHTNSTDKNIVLTEQEDEAVLLDTIESRIEILLHYLHTGSLPWNIAGQPDMEELLLELIDHDPVKLKKAILPQLGKLKLIERLTVIFSFNTIQLLAEQIAGSEESVPVRKVVTLIRAQLALSASITIERELSVIYLKSVHESFFRQKKEYRQGFSEYLYSLLTRYPVSAIRPIAFSIERLVVSENNPADRLMYKSVEEQVKKLIDHKESPVEKKIPPVGETSLPDDTAEHKLSANEQKQKQEQEQAKTDKTNEQGAGDEEEPDRYFIDNAGIVLLNAALIQKHFEQLGWVKDKKITDETSRHKMMLWLDLLVWGERKIHEYGLLLNKILAGVHPEDICDIHVSLEENEKAAAVELLQTVVSHWSILKNTSIEGLRTTFLQREGRLSNEDGGWQLHTAPKAYDILIDSLPWSFSIIKFPWMTKPLFTQWQTKI
jgi:hypothetical protein